MREMRGLRNTLYFPKFAVSLLLKFCSFTKFFSHAKSCAPCSKAKAACKPFDADRARAKARAETIRRSQARKTKQQMDVEWKGQVLEKLGKVNELVVQVRRVADVLERIAGMRPESGGEETETVERIDKGRQREQSSDGAEEEGEEEEEDAMEGVEEGSGGLSPVAYSVGTVAK